MEPAGIEADDEVANRLERELAFNAVDFGRSRIFKDEKLTLDLSDLKALGVSSISLPTRSNSGSSKC